MVLNCTDLSQVVWLETSLADETSSCDPYACNSPCTYYTKLNVLSGVAAEQQQVVHSDKILIAIIGATSKIHGMHSQKTQ